MRGQATFGRRSAPVDAAAPSAARTDVILVRLSKAAAALFALALTYYLSKEFVGYATEPKPLGGMYIDKMPDPFMPWTPVHYPMMLAALFGWWQWPRKTIKLGAWSLLRGGLVMSQIAVFCIFASFLCAYIGQFILSIPFIPSGGFLTVLVRSVGAAAAAAMFFVTFFALLLFPVSIACGFILALLTQTARHHSVNDVIPTPGNAQGQTNDTSRGNPFDTWPPGIGGAVFGASWFSILIAAGIALLLFLSLQEFGLNILFMWASALVESAIPCLVVGGVLRWLGFRWAFCGLTGEILSWYFGYASMQWNGLLIGQIIYALPVIGSTLAGYWIVNSFLMRREQRTV